MMSAFVDFSLNVATRMKTDITSDVNSDVDINVDIGTDVDINESSRITVIGVVTTFPPMLTVKV